MSTLNEGCVSTRPKEDPLLLRWGRRVSTGFSASNCRWRTLQVLNPAAPGWHGLVSGQPPHSRSTLPCSSTQLTLHWYSHTLDGVDGVDGVDAVNKAWAAERSAGESSESGTTSPPWLARNARCRLYTSRAKAARAAEAVRVVREVRGGLLAATKRRTLRSWCTRYAVRPSLHLRVIGRR